MPNPSLTVTYTLWGGYDRFLDAALEALWPQVPEGTRVIVVDNASDTPIAKRKNVDLIRLQHRRTAGVARNAALAVVDTELVSFADVDDRFARHYLRNAVETLSRSSAVAYTGELIHVDPTNDELLGDTWPKRLPSIVYRFPKILASVALINNCVATTNSVLRTEVVRNIGGFSDVDRAEDWTLAAVLPLHGKVIHVERPAVLYSAWEGSKSRNVGSEHRLAATAKTVRERFAACEERPIWWRAAIWLAARGHPSVASWVAAEVEPKAA